MNNGANPGLLAALQQASTLAGFTAAQGTNQQVAKLQSAVEDLEKRTEKQTEELADALENERLSAQAVSNAKHRIQRQVTEIKDAKRSEMKAWTRAALQAVSNAKHRIQRQVTEIK